MELGINRIKNITIIISVVFLLLAVIERWPYGFYTLLRFVVFGTTAYLAWLAYDSKTQGWIWFFGLLALVFNPFIPFHLSGNLWKTVDLLTAVFLTISIFGFKVSNLDEA
jgi:MFS superfamily sulfate permease-like transporter